MADKDTETEEKKKGGKKLFIILGAAAVVVLAAVGVAVMMLMGGGGEKDKAEAAPEAGLVLPLEDEMTLNLADGKFLKVQLALQLTAEATEEAGGEIKAVTAAFDGSMAQDSAIRVFSQYKYNDLLSTAKKEEARKKLAEEVEKRYDGKVMDVYFRQFVMQ